MPTCWSPDEIDDVLVALIHGEFLTRDARFTRVFEVLRLRRLAAPAAPPAGHETAPSLPRF